MSSYGVPQGSVLGPMLFSLNCLYFLSDGSPIVSEAEDTYFYRSFNLYNRNHGLNMNAISGWLSYSCLQIKTKTKNSVVIAPRNNQLIIK